MNERTHARALADIDFYTSEREQHWRRAKKLGAVSLTAAGAYLLDRLGVAPSGVANEFISGIEFTAGSLAGIGAVGNFVQSTLAGHSARQIHAILAHLESDS